MIGQRLRDLREDADLSQEQMGNLISVGKHSISTFERDVREPNDEIKIKIARYFKVSVDYLIGLTNDPKPNWDDSPSYIRLPINFSAETRKEVEDYIGYLAQKRGGLDQESKVGKSTSI